MDIELEQDVFKQNQILVLEHGGHIGTYQKYLYKLHDSSILKTENTNNKLSIILNDFTTRVFANALIDKKKLIISNDKLVFPIKIDFEITNLTFNSVSDDGTVERIKITSIDEYLYEQIISFENKIIKVALVVWKKNIKRGGRRILLLISATNILLTELQADAWKALFGDTYIDCYKYFREQFYKGRYLSDYTECCKLVDEYFEQHDI